MTLSESKQGRQREISRTLARGEWAWLLACQGWERLPRPGAAAWWTAMCQSESGGLSREAAGSVQNVPFGVLEVSARLANLRDDVPFGCGPTPVLSSTSHPADLQGWGSICMERA